MKRHTLFNFNKPLGGKIDPKIGILKSFIKELCQNRQIFLSIGCYANLSITWLYRLV